MIVKEEIFGPIISILKFSNNEDVIKRANNTRYGLAAYILTKDVKFGLKVAERIEFIYIFPLYFCNLSMVYNKLI